MEETIDVMIDNAVLHKVPSLFVKTRIIQDISVVPTTAALDNRKKALINQWAEADPKKLSSFPLITEYRKLQKQLGADQPPMLPAVEGMLTRGILKGRFPKINAVVDVANIISITYLVPIGLFDFDKIIEPVELTLAEIGDQFIPIGKEKPIKLSPGVPVLKDAHGFFSAVGSRDSQRTMIMSTTKNILAFSWGLEGVDSSLISEVLEKCVEEIQQLC